MPGHCDHEPVLYDEDVLLTFEPPPGVVYVGDVQRTLVGTPVRLVFVALTPTRTLVAYACRRCGGVYSQIVDGS